jgi:putative spermidine/putrescine transport system permease protein
VAEGLDSAEGVRQDRQGARRRFGGALWRRPWLKGLSLLSPPVLAFLLVYIAALVALFVSSLWTVDPFTSELIHHWTLSNFQTLWDDSTYRKVALRTIEIAAAVTVTDAIIAFPFAYFMARMASSRMRAVLFVLVLLPLWASYLARVYAWRLILNNDGLLNWSLHKVGLPSAGIAYSNTAMWNVFSYIWLPFMILPLALPGVVAGSIFTFSLTLGDYITPVLIGGSSSQFIGNVVYDSVNQASDLPLAAAFAVVPLAVMGVYLTLARRLGAFEAL